MTFSVWLRMVLALVIVLGGVYLLLGPSLRAMGDALLSERRQRIRSDERAVISSHLHDSVLQTLALIQRRADDSTEVAALARHQERELRQWLYDGAPASEGTVHGAAITAAAEVEDLHRVVIECVVVGDAPLDERSAAMVAAARARRSSTRRSSRVSSGSRSSSRSPTTGSRRSCATAARGSNRSRSPPIGAASRSRSSDGWSASGAGPRCGPRPVTAPRCASSSPWRWRTDERDAVPASAVVVVDDHELFRRGVISEISGEVDVVGEASSATEAVEVIESTLPDVVLLDVHLGDQVGATVVEQIAPRHPDVRFLALSVSDASTDVIALVRAGARGYVTKNITANELVDAVRSRRRRRRGVLAAPRRLRARRVRRRRGDRSRAGPAHGPGAGGDATPGPRLRLQGDRPRAVDLGEDGRDPRVGGAAQAAAVESPRADRWANERRII